LDSTGPSFSAKWMLLRGLMQLGMGYRSYFPNDSSEYEPLDCGELPQREEWAQYAEQLPERSLVALVKGCVLAEEAGSRIIHERHRQEELQQEVQDVEAYSRRQTKQSEIILKRRESQKASKAVINATPEEAGQGVPPRKRPSWWWGERGSTTYTKFLIHPYAARFGTLKADELVSWCLKRSTNPWVPFGVSMHNCESYSDWQLAKSEK
jgi:hypothetical protein